MALLHLPVELLQRIAQETLGEDFESFVVTCKAVYHASELFLPRHNSLRRGYRNFRYRGHGRDEERGQATCSSSLELIAQIADDPLIGRYIVHADFKDDAVPHDEGFVKTHLEEMMSSSNLLELLQASHYLQAACVDPETVLQYLFSEYNVGDWKPGLAAMFLLTLLPNVTQLALPRRWDDLSNELEPGPDDVKCPLSMSWLFDAVVTKANDPIDKTAGLSKLNTILPSIGSGYEARWELNNYTPFLSIKSVRTFVAGGCLALEDGYTGIEFIEPKFEHYGEAIENIELMGACVQGDDLRTFLSRMPHLRSFKLSYETKWHGCGHDWDANDSLDAIGECVGTSLEVFSLSILKCFGDTPTAVTSLKQFVKLRELELDMELLRGPPFEGGLVQWRKRYAIGGDLSEEPVDDLLELPSLGDLLPPTIEQVGLLAGNGEHSNCFDILNHLFANIAAEKDSKLPSLKKIEIIFGTSLTAARILEEVRVENNSTLPTQSAQISPEEPHGEVGDGSRADKDRGENLEKRDHFDQAQKWKEELKALDPSVEVIIRTVINNRRGSVIPQWAREFSSRYGVINR